MLILEKYWSVVNIVQQDLETRKGDKERQIIMIGVRKALSGNGALSLLSLGVSPGLEEVAHGGVTWPNEWKRKSRSGEDTSICAQKIDGGEKMQKENSEIITE